MARTAKATSEGQTAQKKNQGKKTPSRCHHTRTTITSMEEYEKIAKRAQEDPVAYWEERAKSLLHWFKPWETTLSYDFSEPRVEWFVGGKNQRRVQLH